MRRCGVVTHDGPRCMGAMDGLSMIGDRASEPLYPILEFDRSPEAIIEPSRAIRPIDGIAERCVLCFFQEVFDRLKERGQTRQIASLRSEIGDHPVYEMDVE